VRTDHELKKKICEDVYILEDLSTAKERGMFCVFNLKPFSK
jgi:hypothetical protein